MLMLSWARVDRLRCLHQLLGFVVRRRSQFPRQRRFATSPRYKSPESSNVKSKQRTIFSGIQPTGIAHLGNYLGAIQPWAKTQNEAYPEDKLYFSIVDLHSLTSRSQDPAGRRLAKKQTLAILLAAGLSPERCTLFHQSSVKQHAELYWILGCEAGMGWLSRIPTWREKLALEAGRAGQSGDSVNLDITSLLQPSRNPRSQERLKLGLFSYPVLQAADVLLYQTTHVPVGEDQLVNIEFARGAATSFNSIYGGGGAIDATTGRKMKGRQILTVPEPMISKAKRVMGLTDVSKKMSKSAPDPRGRILVTDSPDEIRKKFRAALTDSFTDQGEGITYDHERRPGVSNLLDIIAHVEQANRKACEPSAIAAEFENMQVKGSLLRVLKERAADAVVEHLTPVRERYLQLMNDAGDRKLDEIAMQGALQAAKEAEKTMTIIREVIGL